MRISVIIPAFNEEKSIPYVLNDIPNFVNQVIVCDNSSTDKTSEIAKSFGAKVVYEKKRGYGNACLKAITYLKNHKEKPEIIVANQLGIECLAISVITDLCDPENLELINIKEIIEMGKKGEKQLLKILIELLKDV